MFYLLEITNIAPATLSEYDVTDFVEPAEASIAVIWDTTFSAG